MRVPTRAREISFTFTPRRVYRPLWSGDGGADSKVLLSRTVDLLAQHGYRVGNVDCTVCAERPKINPHIDAMKAVLAPLLRVDLDAVSLKATTSERMGFVGREEGMAAHAVALIERI